MKNPDLTRRTLLAALIGAIALPGVVLAQDPRATQVQKVARDWLALADKLDADAAWNAAAPRFQQQLPKDRWAALLRREREARGAVVQRTAAGTAFRSEGPSLPAGGKYAMVRFRTSFAKQPNGVEEVTLEQGADSVWRVIGYVMR